MEGTTNKSLFGKLASLGRRPQQPLTDLSELYSKIANESILFLKLEEKGRYKQAVQGWKAMTTNVMFQLTMIERQYPHADRYTPEEISLQTGINELYQKSMLHLDRVKELNEQYGSQQDNMGNLSYSQVSKGTRINSPVKPLKTHNTSGSIISFSSDNKGRKMNTTLRDNVHYTAPKKSNKTANRLAFSGGDNNSLKDAGYREPKVFFATSKPLGQPKLNDHKSTTADFFDDFDDTAYQDNDFDDPIEDLIDLNSDEDQKFTSPVAIQKSKKVVSENIADLNRISKRFTSFNGDEDFEFDVDDYFADDYSDNTDDDSSVDSEQEKQARSQALDKLMGEQKIETNSSISTSSASCKSNASDEDISVPIVPPPLPPLPPLDIQDDKRFWSTKKTELSKINKSAPTLLGNETGKDLSDINLKKTATNPTEKKSRKTGSLTSLSKPVQKISSNNTKKEVPAKIVIPATKPISAAAAAKMVYAKKGATGIPKPNRTKANFSSSVNDQKTMSRPSNLNPTKSVPVIKKTPDTQLSTSSKAVKTGKPVLRKTVIKKPAQQKPSSVKINGSTRPTKGVVTSKKPIKPTQAKKVVKKVDALEDKKGDPDTNIKQAPDEEADEAKLKEALEDEIINSLPGVDKTAAKQIFSEIVVHGDEVHWEDIAGLENAKFSLKEAVVYPFLRPDLFLGLREPVRGMLLFGPPGTGKTMLARAVATESHSTFFSISASSLTSKYLGESEKLVRALFAIAKKLSPSIIFVDEIDSIMGSRNSDGENESSRRIKNEFLIQWSSLSSAAAGNNREDGDDGRVLVLAATNLPWSIDEAARRRFVRRQYIPLPEPETRMVQLKKLLSHQKHNLDDAAFAELLNLTEGYSGSDITSLAKDAAMGPLRELGDKLLETTRESIRPLEVKDFKNSLEYIKPSVSQEGLEKYEEWAAKFGSSGV